MTKRVLITGSSSGIGLATAVRLAGQGHQVVATMRDPGSAGPLREAAATVGATVAVEQLDVSDDESVAATFERVGPVDVLVNNAGISPVGAIEEFPLPEWQSVLETNLLGAVRCIQAVAPAMRAQRSGQIINVSSMIGRVSLPMFGPYAASKWALEGMTEALAVELAIFGIHIHLIEPGAIATPIRSKTGAPDRSSPYRPVAKNWGFQVGFDHAHARGPAEVAESVAKVVAEPTSSDFRVTVGQGVDDLIRLRSKHTDNEWIELWSSETGEFLRRYEELTGDDLTSLPTSRQPDSL